MIKIENYIGGIFKKKDYISPSYINLNNPKYIEIDGLYYSNLIIVDYLREQNDLIFKNLIETNENIEADIKKLGFEIENMKNYSYTIKISNEQKAHELLKELVLKGITVNKFEIMKPTLNDIFIEKVGE